MEATSFSTIHLLVEDYYILSVLMKVPYLVGIADPFAGMLAGEAEPITQDSIVRLKGSGILIDLPGGEITMDPAYANIFDSLTSARKIVTVTRYIFFRGEVTRYIHVGTPFYVEMETMPSGHVELSVYQDSTYLERRLLNFLRLPNVEQDNTPEIQLSRKVWEEARQLALSNELVKCTELFIQAEIGSETAAVLASVMLEDSNSGSITVFGKYGNQFRVESQSGWVATEQALWKIGVTNNDIHLSPVTKIKIEEEIRKNLQTVT